MFLACVVFGDDVPIGQQRHCPGLGSPGLALGGATFRDWAPPGWHWEVLPSGTRSLVRIPGDVVDPDLVWWKSRGPRSVQREPAPDTVVRRRIREEEEHVRRYMYLLERQYTRSEERRVGKECRL